MKIILQVLLIAASAYWSRSDAANLTHVSTMNQAKQIVSSRPVMGKRTENLTGKVFNRLTVLEYAGLGVQNQAKWKCACACGNEVTVYAISLKTENTKSCGCLNRELIRSRKSRLTHGMRNSLEYGTWCSIKRRCYNPNQQNYERYGGRGIRMCDRWLNSFENFYEDMGPKPTHNHTIERKDSSKDYSPDNCIWLPSRYQSKNRRTVIKIAHQGKEMILKDWSRELGIPYLTLYTRIQKLGWSHEKALTTPVKYHG